MIDVGEKLPKEFVNLIWAPKNNQSYLCLDGVNGPMTEMAK